MEVYINIEQITGSTGTMYIKFENDRNTWYKDSDVFYADIDTQLNYDVKYESLSADTATIVLTIYDIENNQLLSTVTIDSSAITGTTDFSTSVTVIDMGVGPIDEELIYGPFTATSINLINEISISGNNDNSFYVSADSGVTYHQGYIPTNFIPSGTTIDFYIKRIYTDKNWGVNNSTLTFENNGVSFDIDITSEFELDNIHGQNSINKATGTHSIIGRNEYSANTCDASYSIAWGSDCRIRDEGENNFAIGKSNYIDTNSRQAAIVGGTGNIVSGATTNSAIIGGTGNIASAVENSVIIGGTGQTVTDSNSVYLNGDVYLNTTTLYNLWEEGTGTNSLIPLGSSNLASGIHSISAGGSDNTIEQNGGAILGGYNNTITSGTPGSNSSVIGGNGNIVGENNSTVGGYQSEALGETSFAFGNRCESPGRYGIALGNFSEANGDWSCAIGGTSVVNGDHSFSFGNNNIITSDYATILAGASHIVSGDYSAILGGFDNTINSGVLRSVILGGQSITATENDTVYLTNINVGNNIVFDDSGFSSAISTATLTDERTIYFPDQSGTLALTSDIPAAQDLASVIAEGNTTNGDIVFVSGDLVFTSPPSTYTSTINTATLTADQIIDFPDASGTIALTSDIPDNTDYVDLTTAQTVAGVKTFTDNMVIKKDTPTLTLSNTAEDACTIKFRDSAIFPAENFEISWDAGTLDFQMGPKNHLDAITISDAGVVAIQDASNNYQVKTKVIALGTWDLTGGSVKNVAHGITPVRNIISVRCSIHNDEAATYDVINDLPGLVGDASAWSDVGGAVSIIDSNVQVIINTGGAMDNSDFNDTTTNRGYITIQYI